MRKLSRSINIILILCFVLGVFAFVSADPHSAAFAASAKKPKYIAHRGYSRLAPENSLAALTRAAKNAGFYGVEFDVWESAAEPATKEITETVTDEEGNVTEQTKTVANDPLLLVMHDDNIRRMCGVNKNIRSISRADLDKYTIIAGKKVSKYPGQKIPTSEQAIDAIYRNSNGAIPVIELKHRLSARALNYLLDSIGSRPAVIISFDFNAVADTETMARAKGMSSISTMYLRQKLSKKKYAATIRRMKAAGIDCISLKYKIISKKTVKKFHKAGLKVCAWTLPNKKTARKYARMGVDYITANGKVY